MCSAQSLYSKFKIDQLLLYHYPINTDIMSYNPALDSFDSNLYGVELSDVVPSGVGCHSNVSREKTIVLYVALSLVHVFCICFLYAYCFVTNYAYCWLH